jgi:hypothetical protein
MVEEFEDWPEEIVRPRSWQSDVDVGRLPEAQVPAIIVVVGDEVADRDGQYIHASVGIAIGVMVRGRSRAHGRDIARLYTPAIKGALLHWPDVDGTFSHLSYDGVAYGEVAGDPGVVAATATISFTAHVADTIDLSARPGAPLPDPGPMPAPPDVPSWPDYEIYPAVDETIVDVYKDDDVTD